MSNRAPVRKAIAVHPLRTLYLILGLVLLIVVLRHTEPGQVATHLTRLGVLGALAIIPLLGFPRDQAAGKTSGQAASRFSRSPESSAPGPTTSADTKAAQSAEPGSSEKRGPARPC